VRGLMCRVRMASFTWSSKRGPCLTTAKGWLPGAVDACPDRRSVACPGIGRASRTTVASWAFYSWKMVIPFDSCHPRASALAHSAEPAAVTTPFHSRWGNSPRSGDTSPRIVEWVLGASPGYPGSFRAPVARTMPPEVQAEARRRGLIPDLPADRTQ
jgi:hypothetical protein